jgi:hypothetical protein
LPLLDLKVLLWLLPPPELELWPALAAWLELAFPDRFALRLPLLPPELELRVDPPLELWLPPELKEWLPPELKLWLL